MRVIFPLTALATAGMAYCALCDSASTVWKIGLICADTILFGFLWLGLVKPYHIVLRGMELLSTQESNNRLSKVGQPDADMIVQLFNTLMSKLHHQRLRLREQNSFLERLIQSSPMGILIMDYDYHITHTNPAFFRLAGISDDTIIDNCSLSDLPGPVANEIKQMNIGEIRTFQGDYNNILRCYLLYFMESGFKRPYILLESLTEEIIQAERVAYGKVIRIMAHEVNNSMTGITTLLGILSVCHANDPEMCEFIESVGDRCSALGRFIGAYADVVRLPDPIRERINLTLFLRSQLPFLKSNSQYEIEFIALSEDNNIEADTDMLSQILVNIIKNSNEAIVTTGREDGKIVISVKRELREGIILTITDNGCGVPEEIAPDLFNPFFTTKPGGQGIGLTMVAEILRRHDAKFTLYTDSDSLTHFRIVFKTIS
ncbi:MAG: PAS domain-containing protein [Muribaculaceae bacterium]|nr:PAS domain-containing protein [Muribaculaceae bacterium]